MRFAAILAHAANQLPAKPAHGPLYVETDPARLIVEPWNALSAGLFLLLVCYWAFRIRHDVRGHLFLAVALPILLVGGVGGTIYHAFRGAAVWLAMDWMPIVILCFAFGVYLWARIWRYWPLTILAIPVTFLGVRAGFHYMPVAVAINISYSVMALFILVPAAAVLIRTRFRHGGWVLAAGVFFGLAIVSRMVDGWLVDRLRAGAAREELALLSVLPMGTHFLWHVFGVVATHCGIAYVYRLNVHEPGETAGASPP